jgi:hypothetical protein
MFAIIVLGAWLGGVIVSLCLGNRKMPVIILLLGIGLLYAPLGLFGQAGLALLVAIIWIANKANMK